MSKKEEIKILYIEDDDSARLLLKKVLGKPPFLYMDAPNGLEGLNLAVKERPQLIIMDIDLPDIRGDELTTKIKSIESLKDVIIIALTGLQEQYAREKALVAGCDGFIHKPINVRIFPDQILQFVKGRKELLDSTEAEFYREEYEKSLVDHLTNKVQELQVSNEKLEQTSTRLIEYNESLENVVGIISKLQTCSNPGDFKKMLVEEICKRFKYRRSAFIDVDPEKSEMQITYARGIRKRDWSRYNYPIASPFLQKYFNQNNTLMVRDVEQIEDTQLRELLKNLKTNHFIFAYLGTPPTQIQTTDIRERVMPLLESFMPNLYDQEDVDIEIILSNLEEYLSSESLYRAGFLFLDTSRESIEGASRDYRFLETLMRTASYMYQNISLMDQLRFLFVKAEKEAITDPLTGLYNYRYFIHQLSREISRAQRHDSQFSLIMIDIDYFKNYNDAYGHQAGDLILRRIAQSMLENTRTSDMVCRYGGEEFCIICPELSKGDAQKTAEKLRQIVEKLDLPEIDTIPGGKLTISSGIASFPEDGNTSYQLILKSDKALYRAKKDGRNRVCVIP